MPLDTGGSDGVDPLPAGVLAAGIALAVAGVALLLAQRRTRAGGVTN